jgi:DNA-binding GntR family transcriptional regulator
VRISYQSLKEVVTDRLRREIFEGVRKPGDHLVEQALAAEYGVSRGPVRDAIAQLGQEGLVQVLPRRGTFVTELTPLEAWEVYTLRGHLEGMAVRCAASRWTPAHSARLEELLAHMVSLGPHDWYRAIELDQQFHHLIVQAAANRTLTQIYQTLDSKVVACFLAVKHYLGGMPIEMADRHRDLAAALQQGDFGRAETLAVDHWAETGARFQNLT